MDNILYAGLACVAAAIVGGGLKIFGIEIPLLNSIQRQVLLALFGLILISPSAYSKIKTYKVSSQCDAYAKTAVDQFDENIKLNCNQVGNRWHNNFAGHQGWCLTQSINAIQSETNERNKVLASCQAG